MVRLPSTLELLVEAGESSAEQYELLRWVRCLSPQGLADRHGVLALLDDVAREAAAVARSPEQMPTGGPTLPQIQVGALRTAGYLDEAGCTQFDVWPGEWEAVSRIVAEARGTLRQTRDTIACRTCGQQVPAGARYCGYCGIRVS